MKNLSITEGQDLTAQLKEAQGTLIAEQLKVKLQDNLLKDLTEQMAVMAKALDTISKCVNKRVEFLAPLDYIFIKTTCEIVLDSTPQAAKDLLAKVERVERVARVIKEAYDILSGQPNNYCILAANILFKELSTT